MCDVSTMSASGGSGGMTVLSGALQAYGQYNQGQAARRQGEFVGAQDDYAASVALKDAQTQAQMIRRAGARAVGRADVNAAASGIVVGEGSSGEVDKQIYTDSEHDAYTALLNGSRRARGLQVDAVASRAGGRSAEYASDASAVGTALSAGYKADRAWGGGAFDLGPAVRGWAGTAGAFLDGSRNPNYGNEGRS